MKIIHKVQNKNKQKLEKKPLKDYAAIHVHW